jgi:Carboxypeptidase regulatory-like domain
VMTGRLLGAVLPVVQPVSAGALERQSSPMTAARAGIQGVVTTTAKMPRPIRVTFDQKVCGAELPDQSVVVDGSGHLANVVVTLVGVKAKAPAREITVLNDKCAFVPRVQVAGREAVLKTSSKDPVLHTTTLQRGDGRQLFNLALPVPGMEIARKIEGLGVLRVGCSTHQWMRGWILVTDDVAAVTGPDGRFTLPDVPAGTYQLRVWHEVLKAADRTVTVIAGKPVTINLEMK